MKIAGIAGNRGRNLLHIANISPGGAELSVVVANGEDAPVLDDAAERGIPSVGVERGDDESRESHEERLLDALGEHEFDVVCLDGFMRVLSPEFLDSVDTVLNVHPSILPAFPGADAHAQVLDANVRTTGATVHIATEAVDDGPIVTQETVPVFEDDDEASLKERVLHEAEFEAYPRAVRWFAEGAVEVERDDQGRPVGVDLATDVRGDLPARRTVSNRREDDLRYGENPHQDAAVYASDASEEPSVVHAPQLNEGAKALSYNNYNDADGALNLIKEFEAPAAAVIKHTNPAGCATADTLADAYRDALATDAKSAFGGIVALNRECDAETAGEIVDSFKEVVVAPGYTDDALDVLTGKDNLRVLDVGDRTEDNTLGPADRTERFTEKALVGGRLVQERDRSTITREDLEVATEREPTEEQLETMLFAWKVLKHVKSNGILIADGTETVGVGMGQVSRVDAVELAAMKAEKDADGKSAEGAVVASDAFFPFPDAVEAAADAGVEAVIQPGGSVNDDDVIEAADELGLAMVLTGQRAFRHD
ncbi:MULTISPECIES: bifunctional phosphoribosylaminoimidazolecarboxamide formyltransferase/IMP cyclohydrolase [Halolamina]|uniref:Phosphoribosylaminoimidazolecarboxamide formyltransferase / IMP cyclohydrolase n=1 Tax=Halolamina pelagica TaxID=699431 RepID=A0A1I5NK34_9EURY|nr:MULTISPECIES: bifunctional phosphoribosylaminoimidazolecarboxamide formyltransferase/IMP cyclohydrolase [Halolamina]NHX36354.1 bifunctional phosphoribosylaminoimidazolecarboxamide formyltransferase/IMP cyclohydrolase [Halolamina sp. R1-12]SFP22087.1 phosphoribosylaminoimidazolecarboxamide formyltransferase / IMP cyclohydrolase [Halolamina pelagica]